MKPTSPALPDRPMLAMWRNLPRDKTDTLLLLAACLLVLLPHASHLPLWTSVCTLGILLWRATLTLYGKRLPPSWMIVPIAIASMGVVFLEHHRLLGREPGVAMLVLLLACKLMEMHARRDLFVVIFLALFVILTNFLYSQSIFSALMMVLAVIAMLTAQLSFQYTGRVPPLLRRARQAGLMFVLAVPLALILFVLFPRISGPLWGLPNDAHGGKSGLSDDMSPGNISHLAQSEEIAFRVRFDDKPPPPSQRYWRGPVLGSYDGRTWRRLLLRQSGPLKVQIDGPSYRYQVTQEASGTPNLFALEMARNVPQVDQYRIGVNGEFELLAQRPIAERIRYQVTSSPQFLIQPDDRPDAHWLDLPEGFNPRSQTLANQLQKDFADPALRADAVLRLFHQQPFRYTLNPPLLGMNEIDDFLFETRAGFCEHYASAFVVLMRMSEIPARVVTGYQGGEINPVDGFMIVRQSDAHAWAEIWLEGRGWVRYDPTGAVAPERVEKNLANALGRNPTGNLFGLGNGLINFSQEQFSVLKRWRDNWSAVNNSWNQWVLDYSPKRQRDLLQGLGFKPDWGMLAMTSVGLGMLVMALMMLPLWWQRQKLDPYDALYLRLCQMLAKRGWPRLPHEGPHGYATRLAGVLDNSAQTDAVLRLLAVYSAARYGPAAARPPLATLKALLLQCR